MRTVEDIGNESIQWSERVGVMMDASAGQFLVCPI